MAVNYKLVASIIGAAGTGVGVTTPLVVNATNTTTSPKTNIDLISSVPTNQLVSEKLEVEEVVNDKQIQDAPAILPVREKVEIEDIRKHEEDDQDWREVLTKIRELRQKIESNARSDFSQKHREALENVYERFSTMVFEDSEYNSYEARTDLKRINWSGEQLKLTESSEKENNWGWGEWTKNPFRHFYTDKGKEFWKKRMEEYVSKTEDEDSKSKARAEIEFDIANWLLTEIEKIYEKVHHTL